LKFEHQEKEVRTFLLHNIFIAVVSECLCHLRASYPAQLPDTCGGLVNRFYIFITHVSAMRWLCFLHS